MDEFRDLRHVSAIGGLVKDDVNVIERGRYCAAIAQVTFNEFHLLINPRRPSATVGCGSRLSRPRTCQPSWTRRSTMCEPIRPAAPVTNARLVMGVCSGGLEPSQMQIGAWTGRLQLLPRRQLPQKFSSMRCDIC